MAARVCSAALLVLAVAGCASLASRSGPGWTYKASSGTGLPDGPMALWGEAETMAFHVLRCNARERLLEFEDVEAEPFDGGRSIRFEAGGQLWIGEERMKPDDGVPVAVARLPLDNPVVTAIMQGAPLRISGSFGSFELESHRAVRRVVRECRFAARAAAAS